MSEHFTVATANTFMGQAARQIDGLQSLESSDILLLQEVINPNKDHLQTSLKRSGFDLIHASGRFGLAIALRKDSQLRLVKGSLREYRFQKLSLVERILARAWAHQSHELRERGMIAVKLATLAGAKVTIANVHPGIDFQPRRRANQIERLGQELQNNYYRGALIVAGDMNHAPGPKAVDKALLVNTGLRAVDLATQPTWLARGSEVEKYIRVAQLFNHKAVEDYDGQLDVILYRGSDLTVEKTEVVAIPSDHRAIVTSFSLVI